MAWLSISEGCFGRNLPNIETLCAVQHIEY